jgi:hypothetical protein
VDYTVERRDTDHQFRKKQQMHDLFGSTTAFLRTPLAAP